MDLKTTDRVDFRKLAFFYYPKIATGTQASHLLRGPLHIWNVGILLVVSGLRCI